MAHPQNITIEGVAARAGVSPGTVSRILNGKNKENRPKIAQRSQRIRQLALTLGYRPNAAARSVLRGRFEAVAFVTCGDVGTDWYPISGLNGIHTTLDALNWRLLYNELPASKINNAELVPQLFRETAVDGLIVNLLPAFAEDIVDYFEAQPLPCIWLNLKRKRRAVYPDEMHGSQLAVQWMLREGHHHLGFFSRYFGTLWHYSAEDRLAGFIKAAAAAGLPAHRHFPLADSAAAPVGPVFERALAFLKQFPDVQAVLCYEYEEAICLKFAAEQLGRRVPDDLRIVGFNEREIYASSGLRIPTVLVPFRSMGQHAVESLLRMIDTGDREMDSTPVKYSDILL